jgi:pentatricopeptide repeat protein
MFKYFNKNLNTNITKSLHQTTFQKLTGNLIYPYARFACPLTNEEREKLKNRYSLFKSAKNKAKKEKRNKSIHIAKKNVIVHEEQMSSEMKEELDKEVHLMTDMAKGGEIIPSNKMERMSALDYMKKMDSSFEGFFFKREFNLNNFNYYLQILSRQSKWDQFDGVLTRMQEMGIKPNLTSYTHILTGYARAKDIQKCEEIFDLVKHQKKFIPNKFLYNSLLLAYAKNMKVQEADALMKEMREEGIKPDCVCYTTLINAYKRSKLYSRCWDLYYQACTEDVADEMLMSYMVRLCAATHDSEKALNLYQAMEIKGFTKTTMNYNSIIFALSAKKKYAEKTIEMFHKMKGEGIKPDMHTYVGVLRATTHLGDINTANDVVKEIKLLGYEINEYVCNGLMRTYAGASRLKYVRTEHLDAYIKDAWEIYYFMEKENIPINVVILNSLLEVHTVNHKIEQVEGLVVPLYEKHNIPMNSYSYQHIFGMMIDLRKFDEIVELYNNMKENKIVPTQKVLNCYLEAGMRVKNSDIIVEALQEFRTIERTADPWLIRLLSGTYDLPDRIFAELKEHHLPYNLMNQLRHKQFTPATFRPKSRQIPKVLTRINNKRIKLKK